jgi:hypothetical protein
MEADVDRVLVGENALNVAALETAGDDLKPKLSESQKSQYY